MKQRNPIVANRVMFIKLGQSGEWERECINNGTLKLGYYEVPHDICMSGLWVEAREAFPRTTDPGVVTRHINQVQQFYEEPDTTLWVTFFSDRLWWCFSKPSVTKLPNNSKTRQVIDNWSDSDIFGSKLIKGKLSGKILAIQSYQGAICTVKEKSYLLHKINGTQEPHIAMAEQAVENLILSIIPVIQHLHPTDLEILTDLIFRQAGWQRTGVSGENEKDIDLDLLSPITQERIAVQIKSIANIATYLAYKTKFADMRGFSKFYFVTHSPNKTLKNAIAEFDDDSFIFWGAEQLARQAVRNGLVGWLIDKAS